MNITPERINIQLFGISDISFQIETQQAEINWGDGSSTQLKNPPPSLTIEHSYTKSLPVQLEITGTDIQGLSVSQLGIRHLELQNCPHLQHLDCAINEITDLNLEQCPQLEELYCNSNCLKRLKVAGATHLTQLITAYNEIEELDATDCDQLQVLDCSNNRLSSLLFHAPAQLRFLAIQNNSLEKASLLQIFRQLPVSKNKGILNYTHNPGFSSVSPSLLKEKNWTA